MRGLCPRKKKFVVNVDYQINHFLSWNHIQGRKITLLPASPFSTEKTTVLACVTFAQKSQFTSAFHFSVSLYHSSWYQVSNMLVQSIASFEKVPDLFNRI